VSYPVRTVVTMKASNTTQTTTYVCDECGYHSARWMGFCPQCKRQGALLESIAAPKRSHRAPFGGGPVVSILDRATAPAAARRTVGIGEFDRVVGGGLVPGGVLLVGGEPGVGKSTLLLQVADAIASGGGSALICTAEESTDQIALRAIRVGVEAPSVAVSQIDDVEAIVHLATERRPDLVVVDSIQTVSVDGAQGIVGGTSQVRESAARLIAFAKATATPLVLVGHVTKDGALAGPRTLEHMVDVVLYLEGEIDHGLRFLRSVKNRYGSVNEIGVFEMTKKGLTGVSDPSGLLTEHRTGDQPGSVLFPTVEGRRPMMVEIQALVAPSTGEHPRRAVNGLPSARVHQILGIVERHAGIALSKHEVYVSVMGGVRITEPASDLPVALAVASSVYDVPLGATAAFGELGLTGEVRPVPRSASRLAEVERLGARPLGAHSKADLLVGNLIATMRSSGASALTA